MLKILYNFLLIYTSIVNALYTPIYFEEEEVRHVRSIIPEKPPCNEEKLIGFLADRQISSPESIIGIAIGDFESTCSGNTATLRKVNEYLKNCTIEKNLYINLLSGLKAFDEKLCKNNEFYRKYDKYDKCYTDLDKDYDSCDGTADWNESEPERTCRIFKRIIDCYYIKTAKVCGIKAAITLKELMVEVIECSLTVKCYVGSNPKVKDPMPDKYIDILQNGPHNDVNYCKTANMLVNTFLVIILLILM